MHFLAWIKGIAEAPAYLPNQPFTLPPFSRLIYWFNSGVRYDVPEFN